MSAVIHHLPAAQHRVMTPERRVTTSDPRATVPGSCVTATDQSVDTPRVGRTRAATDEEGSLVTEYGLLAVVAATIAGVVISWASNGALVSLFNALLRHARGLVGA
jgi:Flp pilus assembly pilin Flp